jgi:hypothetical protein
MGRRILMVMKAALLSGATAAAQTAVVAAPPRATNKVLSTVPTPPAGVVSQPTQMSGMPLQVGDLPPGTVAVRVVRNPFANVVGQPVTLHRGSESRAATTGDDGRATFAGLRVGDEVYASTVVDAETLESARFRLPSDGGVRLLLVAGAGPTGPVNPGPIEVFGATPGTVPESALAAAPSVATRPASAATLRLTAMAILATAAALFVIFSRSTGTRAVATARTGSRVDAVALAAERNALLDELVRLDQQSAATGATTADVEHARAEVLRRLTALRRAEVSRDATRTAGR